MIELPWPSPALWPNHRSRTHWARTKALAKARQDGFLAAHAAKVGIVAGDVPVRLSITVHPRNSRRQCQPDKDAVIAALKGYFDGIADALKINDRVFEPQAPLFAEPIKGGKIIVEMA